MTRAPLLEKSVPAYAVSALRSGFSDLALLNAGVDRAALDGRLCKVAVKAISATEARLHWLLRSSGEVRVFPRAAADRMGYFSMLGQEHVAEEDLPPIADCPLIDEAVRGDAKVSLRHPSGDWRAVYPIRAGASVVSCLELRCPAPLGEAADAWLMAAMTIYGQHAETLDYAERDALTGLLNRKTFEGNFGRLVSGASEIEAQGVRLMHDRRRSPARGPTWLAMFDVDHFKRINDRFGHLHGDEVLLAVARALVTGVRTTDRVYRFGGEEFAVVLGPTPAESAPAVFERLRERIAAMQIPGIGSVTVSAGFCALSPGDAPPIALERADRALYFAKDHGRNRCESFDRLFEAGLLQASRIQDQAEIF